MKAALFVLLLSAPAWAQEKPFCTVDGVSKQCASLKDAGSTQWIYLKDGTYFRNPEYDNSYWSYLTTSGYNSPSIPDSRRRRILELVEFSRGSMIRQILRGRKFADLSVAEKSEYERVRTVRFDFEQSLNDESTICTPGAPNAYYEPTEHRMTLCRSAMMMPDSALAMTIGHELAHSIDACEAEMPLVQRPGAAGNYALDISAISPLPAEDLWRGGAPVIAPAILPWDYPQKAELDCFAKAGLQQKMSESEILDVAKRNILYYILGGIADPGTADFWKTHQVTLDRMVEKVRSHPNCFRPKGNKNAIGETMADMWAARVLADYHAANPARDAHYPLPDFALFLPKLCGPQAAQETDEGDEHVPTTARINSIILANPDLQKQMNCRPDGPSCDKGAGTAPPVPASELSAPAAQ